MFWSFRWLNIIRSITMMALSTMRSMWDWGLWHATSMCCVTAIICALHSWVIWNYKWCTPPATRGHIFVLSGVMCAHRMKFTLETPFKLPTLSSFTIRPMWMPDGLIFKIKAKVLLFCWYTFSLLLQTTNHRILVTYSWPIFSYHYFFLILYFKFWKIYANQLLEPDHLWREC